MRPSNAFAAILAMGLSLVACTDKDAGTRAIGHVAAPPSRPGAQGVAASSAVPARHARFASLPDRGELLHYDAQAPIRDGAYTWHRTELSERHALDAIATGTLRITTPAGRVLGFEYDRSIRHDDTGDWTWIGHLPGQEGVQAILTFGAGAVYGSIGQPDTRPLRLTMRGGASWLVETDPKQLAGLASHAANPISPDYRIVSPAALKRILAARGTSVKSGSFAPTAVSAGINPATPTVDLVIGYTQGFLAESNGDAFSVETRLNNMVDTANQGLRNSQVNGQVRLVRAMQVNYTDTNTNAAALGQLTGYDSGSQKPTTPNAAFNALRTARETYGADLVSLVRPFKDPEQDSCGIAWLVGGGKQEVRADNGWDFFGYSVVSDGTDTNEQDGKTYYCEEHTLAHELGHNMGSQHDRNTAKGDDGVLDNPDDYGAFDYSFGYKPTTGGRNFYTIMAYGDSGQIPYLTFSNPRTTFCGGKACGVNNSEDNAKSLGTLLPLVAEFRSATLLPAARRIDANGNGYSDLFFFNHSSGQLVTWFMSGTTRSAYSSSAIPGAYQVLGVGNFNADSRDDILLSTRDGKMYLATSNGTTYTTQSVPYTINSRMLGTGDVDGNGKADIVIYNPDTYQLVIWYTDAAIRARYTTQSNWVGDGMRYIASADFNGDKKEDLLFEGPSRYLYISQSAGNRFDDFGTGLTYSTDYALRGAADMNGDGKADILLHSAKLNKLVVWYMSFIYRTSFVSIAAPAGAKLVAFGDFDHNGRNDILWAHPTNGSLWLTLSTGTGFKTSLLPYTFMPSSSNPMDIDI